MYFIRYLLRFLQNVYGHGRLSIADSAAPVFGHRDAGILYLSFSRFAAKLGHQLVSLR
jgi:hypothetical protein